MPRQARVAVANVIYHVINLANGRAQIFHDATSYRHFESLLLEAKELTDMRILDPVTKKRRQYRPRDLFAMKEHGSRRVT